MLPPSGLSTLSPAEPLAIDIRRFPWIKPLAADYAFDPARLLDFYAGNPADDRAWADALARTRAYARPRAAVADLLVDQLRRRGAPPEAIAAAGRLRQPDTAAVLTGQQAGLFGGPTFTLLKALTALRTAEEVARRHNTTAVAIFWIDAEDHDWNEVRACGLLDGEMQARTVSAGDLPGANSTAVGRITLDESIWTTIDALAASLPPSEFTGELIEALRRAYQPGVTMADAFGRWLDRWLGPRGLIVFDASDPAAKPLVAELFAREIETASTTSQLALQAGQALEARGYHVQATPQSDSAALFRVSGGREAIRVQSSETLVAGDAPVPRHALAAEARQSPQHFSPNVLLRPLVQDTLFPTVCYVSGPSELAYLGQLKGVYTHFGVPMPLIVQRASATILDSNAMRFLARHEFPLESLRARDEAALNELLNSQLPPGVEAAVTRLAETLDTQMDSLADAVKAVDATLEGAARSAQGRMRDDLQKLQGKIIQAAKKKDSTLRRQFQHAQLQAFPNGHPQEREVGFVYFLNKYGPTLIDRLAELLPGAPGVHYVLTI